MQTRLITKDFIQSAACTLPMLMDIGLLLGMSQAALDKVSKQPLGTKEAAKANGTHAEDNERRTSSANLENAKLRIVLLHKFAAVDCEFGAEFAKGELYMDLQSLPDLDMGQAGANTKRQGAATGGAPRKGKLAGAYKVVKRPASASVNGGDEGKWAIWQHVWACTSFEEYFACAPAKGVTSATNRVISASSSINWALKAGWIVPVSGEEAQEQEQQAA